MNSVRKSKTYGPILKVLICVFLSCIISGKLLADEDCSVAIYAIDSNSQTVQLAENIKQSLSSHGRYKTVYVTDLLPSTLPCLIIANGLKEAVLLKNQGINVPVLVANITRVAYEMNGFDLPNFSAVFSDPSIKDQLRLIDYIFKRKTKIAVFLGEQNKYLVNEITKLEPETDHIFVLKSIKSSFEVPQAIKHFEDVDVILAMPDNSVFNKANIRRIVLNSHAMDLAIVGYSKRFVKAGALASIYYEADHLTEALLKQVDSISVDDRVPAPVYPDDYSIAVNEYMASALDRHDLKKQLIKADIEKGVLGNSS